MKSLKFIHLNKTFKYFLLYLLLCFCNNVHACYEYRAVELEGYVFKFCGIKSFEESYNRGEYASYILEKNRKDIKNRRYINLSYFLLDTYECKINDTLAHVNNLRHQIMLSDKYCADPNVEIAINYNWHFTYVDCDDIVIAATCINDYHIKISFTGFTKSEVLNMFSLTREY